MSKLNSFESCTDKVHERHKTPQIEVGQIWKSKIGGKVVFISHKVDEFFALRHLTGHVGKTSFCLEDYILDNFKNITEKHNSFLESLK